MTKPFEFHGVEAEKKEAMRRDNNRRSFRNILRATAVVSLCYLWLPTVAISLQAAGGWLYKTGSVIITNSTVVFVFANLLVALIFLLSRNRNGESTEPDLYHQYTSSTAVIVTASASNSDEKMDDDESNKQIVPAFIAEVEKVVVVETNREAVTTESKGIYRRTKSETTKKEILRPVREFRRTESANSAMERLSSEEFRLKVETFIMEKKRSLVQENGVVQGLVRAASGYGSC